MEKKFYFTLLIISLIKSFLLLSGIDRPDLINQLIFPTSKINPTDLRAISYNIRADFPIDQENGNGWQVRKYQIKTLLNHYDPDIIGLQEVSTCYLPDILELFPAYTCIAFEACPKVCDAVLLVKNSRFKIEQANFFWISPALKNKNPHLTTYAILQDLKTQRSCACFCTHFDSGATIGMDLRIENAKILIAKQAELAYNLPTIILGDFNFITNNKITILKNQTAYNTITEHTGISDVRDLCQKNYGPDGSWIGWRYDQFAMPPNSIGSRLDQIFVKDYHVLQTGVLNLKINSKNDTIITPSQPDFMSTEYPSDHLPIVADLNFLDIQKTN